MTTTDAPIAEALEKYCQARGVKRGTRDWCQLLAAYQRKPEFFAQLLDRELKQTEGSNQ